MIRQCAKCLKIMGTKPPLSDMSITHGICLECSVKQLQEAGIVVTKEMMKRLKEVA